MLLKILPFVLYKSSLLVQASKADHAHLTYLMLQRQLSIHFVTPITSRHKPP
jgi:hypothetical protein